MKELPKGGSSSFSSLVKEKEFEKEKEISFLYRN